MRNILNIAILFFCVSANAIDAPNVTVNRDYVAPPAVADVLTEAKYAGLKSEFLNIDPRYYTELNFADFSAENNEFAFGWPQLVDPYPESLVTNSHQIFGVRYPCTNKSGEPSVCFMHTGGKRQTSDPSVNCGAALDTSGLDSYTTAAYDDVIANQTDKFCDPVANPTRDGGFDNQWGGWWFWGNQWYDVVGKSDFVLDGFPKTNIPVNRMCIEAEFPTTIELHNDDVDLTSADTIARTSQLVNPLTLHPNLQEFAYQLGTYTANIRNSDGTAVDEEWGGNYQNGQSHYYHRNGWQGRVPVDRAYAVDENTILMCIGTIPSDVRAAMRPAFAANPLLSMGGEDGRGITNGLSYLNYLTRFYWAYANYTTNLTYPWTMSLRKVFMAYEDDEIFAMTKDGATVSDDMVELNDWAYFPFTVVNTADEDRDYYLVINGSDVFHLQTTKSYIKLYEDTNDNGILDGTEGDNEIAPTSVVTLTANTDKSFILARQGTFDVGSQYPSDLHGTKVIVSSLSLAEKGGMRSAQFATRLFQGTAQQVANKAAFLKDVDYPSDTSEWSIYKHLNNQTKELCTYKHLCGTPTFKKAYRKLKGF